MQIPIVSIVTVSFNSFKTISLTIDSVLNQTYHNIEYIVIDSGSTDGTVDLIKSYGGRIDRFISEPDKGIYDAINKGIRLSTGEIIGILNSDDFFYDNNIIQKVVDAFSEKQVDAVYGDLLFVDRIVTTKVTRKYSSERFNPGKFRFGFMPAHPTFYAKRELFDRFGYYKTDYKIAADFELLLRFILINKITCKYLKMNFVNMRRGGTSTKSLRSNLILNKEIARACKENGIHTNYCKIYSKYLLKVFEYFRRQK